MTTSSRLSCYIVTAVWGEWHIDTFLRYSLPTAMSPNNLPVLAAAHDVIYKIFTRPGEGGSIEDSPIYRKLAAVVRTEIVEISDIDFSDPISAHAHIWRVAIGEARLSNSTVVLFIPDFVWADGCLASLAEGLAQGKKATYSNSMRAVSESLLPQLDPLCDGDKPITIAPSDLVRLGIEHIHPLTSAYLYDSERFTVHPQNIMWSVPGEGFLVRCPIVELLSIDPNYFELTDRTLLQNYKDPDDVLLFPNSDQMFALSLASISKDIDWYFEPRRCDVLDLARWWMAHESPANRQCIQQRFRFHTGTMAEDKWREVERQSDEFVEQLIAASELHRVYYGIRDKGFQVASRLLACFIVGARLYERFSGIGEATFLVPSDEAFDSLPDESLGTLISHEHEANLLRFFESHIVPSKLQLESAVPLSNGEEALSRTLETLNGSRLHLHQQDGQTTLGDAKILDGPFGAGDIAIYSIDRLLNVSDWSTSAGAGEAL